MHHHHGHTGGTSGEEARAPSGQKMVLTMGTVGLIAGLMIVVVFQITLPIIQQNKAEQLERAIFEVLPDISYKKVFRVDEKGMVVPYQGDDPRVFKLYAGYDANHQLKGVAVEAEGQGFQDVIRLIYGYSPEQEAIVGMKVLESKETPGLGDKIQRDPQFLENFRQLDVTLGENFQLKNPITLVKHGQKTEKWQIEGITGATISSRAITNILRESSERVIPIIRKNLEILKSSG